MAKTKNGDVGFSKALDHMKEGRRATRNAWFKMFNGLRIDDTGLGLAGEFIRTDTGGHSTRYPLGAEDILAEDWRLL